MNRKIIESVAAEAVKIANDAAQHFATTGVEAVVVGNVAAEICRKAFGDEQFRDALLANK